VYVFFLVGDKLILPSPVLVANTSVDVNKSVSYVQSPIGKIMVENIDNNLSYVKEKNLSGRSIKPMSNETNMSSNDKNNDCVFFVCIYFNDLTI